MKKLFLLICTGFIALQLQAQELRCEVVVNSSQIAQVDRSIFDALQKSVYEFMNNTAWTSETYKEEEKIKCQIFINVTGQEKDGAGQVVADKYIGTILVQSSRPIYNTNQESILLNFQDDNFTFSYIPFQQMFYSENSAQSNLTQVLAFYAYFIIGLDKDSFGQDGGEDFLIKAQQCVNNAASLPDIGWRANENNRNRYYLVNDYLNTAFEPLRSLMYNYHRNGLDVWYPNMEQGRQVIADALKTLDQIWTQRPNAFLLQIFFLAKRTEIISLFKQAPPNVKADLIPVLKKVDPTWGAKYDDLNK